MSRIAWAFLPAMLLAQEPVFRADVKLVEVYATVVDPKGRYVDGLAREQFLVSDEGRPQPIAAFESHAAEFSCALLLDTTGSMANALPAVKNAVMNLLDQFRENDWIGVYRFSGSLALLQDFTRDKALAKAAVLRTRAAGPTALLDAISAVARDIARRNGKKFLVVFTDGQDNASVLNVNAAVERARKVGVPVYAIAQGEALKSRQLLDLLRRIARNTGGRAYAVRKSGEIGEVFDDISRELKHTYFLAYKAPPADQARWRAIHVSLAGPTDCRIRTREGYFPD